MTRLVRLTATVALLVAPLFLVSGCKQGVGDRCQVQTDCDDGLLCVLAAGATPQAGGTCQMPGGGADLSAAPADLTGVIVDMAGMPAADLSNTTD